MWSGPPADQPRRVGVALAVDSNAYRALCSWQPISDRILVANFKHSFGKLSIVAVYAPTEEASEHEKDAFYTRLDQAMALTHRNNLILCLGDFNAVSGSDRSVNSTVVGPFGAGIPNDNSERLLDFCIGNDLRINGSWFRRDDIHRHSWYSMTFVLPRRLTMSSPTRGSRPFNSAGCTAAWSSILRAVSNDRHQVEKESSKDANIAAI